MRDSGAFPTARSRAGRVAGTAPALSANPGLLRDRRCGRNIVTKKIPILIRYTCPLPSQFPSGQASQPHPPGPKLTVSMSLPAHVLIQTNPSPSPAGVRDGLTPLFPQSLPPTARAAVLSSWVQPPCGPAWCWMICSPGCERK